MQDFRRLKVWERAHQLTLAVYSNTVSFPHDERYGLTSQIRRAAASIPANLAEGCGRGGDADFRRFVQIAMGSACELEYHLLLACDLKLLEDAAYQNLVQQVTGTKRMLASLLVKLRADS
jgi:four helix bundle protein